MLRRRLTINGIVQGVGFRPFIYSLARDIGLVGSVYNTSDGVKVELQGSLSQLEQFDARLRSEAPPLSTIISVKLEEIPILEDSEFTIVTSHDNASVSTLISPDVALCDECKDELFDEHNRRYRYPFINCTNCGPRYTIIENIPYDRRFTSMKHFPLCEVCHTEYQDPADRRFHAQPNACPECGPQVWLTDQKGERIDSRDSISKTIDLLVGGKILAIKGLGGFHLAVDATNADAIARLRLVKGRDEKPLALMVRGIDTAQELVDFNQEERATLLSIQAPIVLCTSKANAKIASNIAPGNDRLGVMLPYTPLHHLLLSEKLDTLVMTSANFSEEPICIDNDESLDRLSGLADYFLLHNRDIYLRSDDSVVMEMSGTIRPIRRSRGFAPRPIFMQNKGPSVLAVGGELKNVVGLSKDEKVFLSQHIGDLENLEAFEFFQMTIDHIQQIFEIEPELIIHDLHPEYLSTKWAKDQSIPLLGVQHHHAHLAACMAENNLDGPVIGIIMDGTGYGTDGTIWGGEFLLGDANGFERMAHFEPMPLPGGEAAIKSPWRIGLSYLHQVFDSNLPDSPALKDRDIQPIIQMLDANINSPLTSSCGRLFDAVAALSGGRQEIRYEAQAAIEFMQVAQNELGKDYSIFAPTLTDGKYIIPIKSVLENLLSRIDTGRNVSQLSQWFHNSLIHTFVRICEELRSEKGIEKIVLSGGVFQNRLLFEGLLAGLAQKGFSTFTHQQVPCNDGGLALGQVAIGLKYLQK
ncbi:MAG: carbamoyltransferase HypF [Candidatus Marinimicrobia bacterium]|jgi:hydrogenase maturation protein HypF|nr:carbamoyltransferase HypF [Candidatus Neomarinimicrobiota bacterium]MBT4360259.1 carbamoyltransferase HypF [Candidatus Neomarinimicrobiota bacterium]MBT4715715.1 carbamoyltransferase HypF [Candidatus Neomarinimicrobiota bacterium]MBT4947891.1 carbamoyltransferase HypF [Candidatus Neomarinimicrobiota bacterium]MBT5267970.1 carbamoyltransferase HypF [Candidatus Neomarinimicrobiota bacterium]